MARRHTQLVMSPLEFVQRLAALVPRPRLHLIRSMVCWQAETAGSHGACTLPTDLGDDRFLASADFSTTGRAALAVTRKRPLG